MSIFKPRWKLQDFSSIAISISWESLISTFEVPFNEISIPPFIDETRHSISKLPDNRGMKLAATSLLEPGEITI